MEFKILTDELEDIDAQWKVFICKAMISQNLEKLKDEMIIFAELDCYEALYTWYEFFPVGENLEIDRVVDAYPDMTKEEALDTVDYCLHYKKVETEQDQIENSLKFHDANRALLKHERHEKKIKFSLKNFKNQVSCRYSILKKPEEVIPALDALIEQKEAHILDIMDLLGPVLRQKIELNKKQKEFLNYVKKQKFCKEYITKLKQKKEENNIKEI